MEGALTIAVQARPAVDVGELFERQGARIGAFIRRRTGEGAHVDDLVQETFLVAHRRAATYRGDAAALTWLFGIANNLCRRHARGRRRLDGFLARLVGRPEPVIERADELLGRTQEIATARAAIAALPDALREVFVLYELEEVEGEAIAGLLDLPIGTVWSRLRSARLRFTSFVQRRRAREEA